MSAAYLQTYGKNTKSLGVSFVECTRMYTSTRIGILRVSKANNRIDPRWATSTSTSTSASTSRLGT